MVKVIADTLTQDEQNQPVFFATCTTCPHRTSQQTLAVAKMLGFAHHFEAHDNSSRRYHWDDIMRLHWVWEVM